MADKYKGHTPQSLRDNSPNLGEQPSYTPALDGCCPSSSPRTAPANSSPKLGEVAQRAGGVCQTQRAGGVCQFLLLLLLSSCRADIPSSAAPFAYPSSKFWAHCANTVELGREKAPLFDGLEVDINYSAYQDQLFMGHDLFDTIHSLTFDAWLDSLPQPVTNCLWLDTKNLSTDNASAIAHRILESARRHGIADRVMVENWDAYALRIVKDSGLHVILWVDNPYWSGHSEEEFRTRTQEQIGSLHPDALSGDYHNFPRLPEAFPDQNIHIWDTPRAYNDTNVAHSQMIAAYPAVKVVLVDYPRMP